MKIHPSGNMSRKHRQASAKESAIEMLEIAHCNLLESFQGLRPEDVYKQIHPEANPIGWIIGHCIVHMHWMINLTYMQERVFSEEVCHYYRYGTTKDEILADNPPISFLELIDDYLHTYDSALKFLHTLDDETFHQGFGGENYETLLQSFKRVSFHYMGHVGQIVLLRRILGNPGLSFVDAIVKQRRDTVEHDWSEWWNAHREEFKL
ncbi:MAG: DinB family protein [Candidatus Thorarchaeota archaeon]